MTKTASPPTALSGFLMKAKQSDCAQLAEAEDAGGHRHLQVRLALRDAKRVKCLADMRGMSIQDALVAGINALMSEWSEPPVANPGARSKKQA